MTAGPADLPTFAPPVPSPAPTPLPPTAPAPANPGPSPYVAAHVEHLMGMPISIHVRGPQARSTVATAAVRAAYDDLAWVDETLSKWKPDSELSRLRRGELTVEECCAELSEVLALGERYGAETDGAFLTLLPDEETGEWLVDPTGLVKGWAIARAAAILAAAPALAGHAYCVNAGGDIAVGGLDTAPGGDRPWRLGIEDPEAPGQIARVVELREGALATSGCAARGAHLVDPASGQRRWQRGSVSVVAPDIVDADVWATALFVGPPELQRRVADRPGWQIIRL